MPEPILILAVLLVAGAVVLWPLRRPAASVPVDAERDAATVRHRVALEALRDVEADRRAGSLDERGYAEQLAEAEAHAAETAAELDASASAVMSDPGRGSARRAIVVAGILGVALVAGSLLPAGIANSTDVNEGLAAAEAAEASRQDRIERLLDELAAEPESADTLSDLADAYLASSTGDDLARAAAALQALIAIEPDRADAYERLIGAYLRAGDVVNARRAFDSYEALETASPVEVAFLDGIIALSGEGEHERAVEAFDRFLELAPDDPRAEMVRGLRSEADGD